MSSQPLLSIGMIVKNEMRCIERCLMALQPLRDTIPCQLVIADTGSTDGTREVVERYADIFFDFEWINDFAAARNAVLDRCNGKWYMTVDADEYLVPNLDELVTFLTGPESKNFDFCNYVQRNHKTLDMKGLYGDFFALRMARIHSQLRYYGEIHESFLVCANSKIKYLKNTILDHDGYANVTPEHMKKKEERNLALLEPLLEQDPHNLRRLIQCIESSSHDKMRQLSYVRRGMDELMEGKREEIREMNYAPAITRYGIMIAANEFLPEVDVWYQWAMENFPDSDCIRIDAKFYYAASLHARKRYGDMIPVGNTCLEAIKQYVENGPPNSLAYHTVCYCAHPIRASELRTLLAEAYYEEGKKRQAVKLLEGTDLTHLDTKNVKIWFSLFERMVKQPSACKTLHNKLLPFYEGRNSGNGGHKNLWSALRVYVEHIFSVERKSEDGICNLYKGFPGILGICAELVDAKTTEEAQVLLSRIEDWENLMPLALVRALELGCTLPDGFYHITPERLHDFCLILASHWKGTVQYALSSMEPGQITDWHSLCFAFDLLCAIGMRTECFKGEQWEAISDRLAKIGALYLQNCYNPRVLEDEEAVDRLPPLHRFAWHFARAVNAKQNNDLVGYMRSLRTALKKAELMKDFVEYLLNDIDIEEIKRREHVAAAPPELRELAEKVKTLLARYPADDPSVIALKQTPVYQKVAYLIEDTQNNEC